MAKEKGVGVEGRPPLPAFLRHGGSMPHVNINSPFHSLLDLAYT